MANPASSPSRAWRLGVIAPVLLWAACFDPVFGSGGDDDERDASTEDRDGAIAADGAVPFDCTWAAERFDGCEIPMPRRDAIIDTAVVFDTDTGQTAPFIDIASDELGPDLWVISVLNLEVRSGGSLRFVGSRPIVVAAFSTITVAAGGSITVSSTVGDRGAGSGIDCGAGAPGIGTSTPNGHTGGGGGGFGGAGGEGGAVPSMSVNVPGGTAGDPVADTTVLQGGCDGAPGLLGTPTGGPGGGAIQLAARSAIEIAGTVEAGGGGGVGGAGNNGGGGGGSGGAISLEGAVVLAGTARVTANGGGGGGGGSGATGKNGDDGRVDASRAAGGLPGASGATAGGGGNSSVEPDGQTPPPASAGEAGGGGGGGGGAGIIRIVGGEQTVAAGAIVSPQL